MPAIARSQVVAYPTVSFTDKEGIGAAREPDGFSIQLQHTHREQHTATTRRVIRSGRYCRSIARASMKQPSARMMMPTMR